MSDKELLELAAKAAGIVGTWERRTEYVQERWYFNVPYDNHGMLSGFEWNPLADDGDALRLAVKLGMQRCLALEFGPGGVCATFQHPVAGADEFMPLSGDFDPHAATRRAITRAAAEIGRAKP